MEALLHTALLAPLLDARCSVLYVIESSRLHRLRYLRVAIHVELHLLFDFLFLQVSGKGGR